MTEDATQDRTEETREEEPAAEAGSLDDAVVEDPIEDELAEQEPARRPRLRETPEERETRVAELRLSLAKEVATQLRHKRGCPDEGKLPGEGDSRVEHFPATKPATANTPQEDLLVVRCSRCGESEVVPDESEA